VCSPEGAAHGHRTEKAQTINEDSHRPFMAENIFGVLFRGEIPPADFLSSFGAFNKFPLANTAPKSIYLKYIFKRRLTMKTAKIFQNGQSQAVRLPKEFRFEDSEVYIKKSGNVVQLIPRSDSWNSLFGSLKKFSDDFMAEREQPAMDKRESF
jgi:antitoxin VapB